MFWEYLLSKVHIGRTFRKYAIQKTLSPEFNLKENIAVIKE
jgi:hypothetical protein